MKYVAGREPLRHPAVEGFDHRNIQAVSNTVESEPVRKHHRRHQPRKGAHFFPRHSLDAPRGIRRIEMFEISLPFHLPRQVERVKGTGAGYGDFHVGSARALVGDTSRRLSRRSLRLSSAGKSERLATARISGATLFFNWAGPNHALLSSAYRMRTTAWGGRRPKSVRIIPRNGAKVSRSRRLPCVSKASRSLSSPGLVRFTLCCL